MDSVRYNLDLYPKPLCQDALILPPVNLIVKTSNNNNDHNNYELSILPCIIHSSICPTECIEFREMRVHASHHHSGTPRLL